MNSSSSSAGDLEDDSGEIAPRDAILAISSLRQNIGVALYTTTKNAIYTAEISGSSATLSARLEEILLTTPPKLVLTNNSTANNLSLISFLTSDGDADHEVTPGTNWDYAASKIRIVEKLHVRELLGSFQYKGTDRGRAEDVKYDNMQMLASELPFQERGRISALGALTAWLSKHVFDLEKKGHVHIQSLASIESLVQSHCVIDPVSLRALAIFVEEFHPSQVKGRGRSKEGFSLFGIFDRSASKPGRRCLKEWFRSPLASAQAIRLRQDGVQIFVAPEVQEIEGSIHKALRKMHDLPSVLLRVKKVQSTYRDWCQISETCEALWSIIDLLRVLLPRVGDTGKAWISDKLDRCDIRVLQQCYHAISESIDVELSKKSKQTCIREGYDEVLDDLRAQWDCVENILETAAKQTLDVFPSLATVRAEFIAHIGYHIVLPQNEHRHLCDGDGASQYGMMMNSERSSLEFMFEQDELLYFKTPLMRQYDTEYGDIPSHYHDKVKELLRGLEEELLAYELQLTTMDACISLARIAREYDFVRPRVVESPVVLVKGGRHPLQQLVVDTFIPNDVALGAEGINGAIITGPNFSGKSVYLKMVGVIVFLSQVGSFVPADDAIIGVMDRIFTRIESLETCTVAQSTFGIDLNQMAVMLRRCTKRSLLLVDEFGKGTAPADGMALLAAMIESIVEEPNPLFMVSTHFLEIFEMKLLDSATDAKLRKFRMDFILPKEKKNRPEGAGCRHKRHKFTENDTSICDITNNLNDDSMFDNHADDTDYSDPQIDRKDNSEDEGDEDGIIVPLFKLVPGVATSSDGLACAKLANVPTRTIRRSREVLDAIQSDTPLKRIEFKSESSLEGEDALSNSDTSTNEIADELLRVFLSVEEPFESCDEESVQNLTRMRELVNML